MSDDEGGSRFDWDDANTDHIWDQHRITVEEAEDVFDDPRRFFYRSDTAREQRVTIVGRTRAGRTLAVVATARNSKTRVVTARDANEWESKRYRRSGRRGRN